MRTRLLFLSLVFLPSLALAQDGGSLTVQMQESATVASIPRGAQRVLMLTAWFTASCDQDVPVRGLELEHRGMGALEDIAGVYAESGGRRISRSRTFSSHDAALSLNIPTLTVPACTTVEVLVRANFSADAAISGEHRLIIPDAAAILTDARVTLKSASTTLRRTTGERRGTVTAEVLPPLNAVRYGDNRIVARLRLSADQQYDQEISSIILTNQGSARDQNLQHITAVVRGNAVTQEAPTMRGKEVTLLFDPPLLLERGTTRLIDVRADVRSGVSRTIGFTVEEAGDVSAFPVTDRR